MTRHRDCLPIVACCRASLASHARRSRRRQPPADSRPRRRTAATPPAQQDDPDRDINLAQPDFTLAALPTTLRLPRYKSAFRMTHRFGRPLGAGDFGDLRRGSVRARQWRGHRPRIPLRPLPRRAGRHPSHVERQDHSVLRPVRHQEPARRLPDRLRRLASIEGTNNFKDSYSPGLGVAALARNRRARGGLRRAVLGEQHATRNPKSSSTTTTRSSSASARACASVRPSICWSKARRASAATIPGVDACQLRHREARGRPHASS